MYVVNESNPISRINSVSSALFIALFRSIDSFKKVDVLRVIGFLGFGWAQATTNNKRRKGRDRREIDKETVRSNR